MKLTFGARELRISGVLLLLGIAVLQQIMMIPILSNQTAAATWTTTATQDQTNPDPSSNNNTYQAWQQHELPEPKLPKPTKFADLSPWVSYPKQTNSSIYCETWKTTTKYAPRVYLGGGKAGSTGLWTMIMSGTPWSGAGPNSSDFIGFAQEFPERAHERGTGKEMCFGANGRYQMTVKFWESLFEPSSTVSNIGLDCCPQGTEKSRVCNLWRLFPCEVKFLMPVRDPADRAVSWFNDKASSHNRDPSKVDFWTQNFVKTNRNFQLHKILSEALQCVDPRAIMVMDTDGLKASAAEVQGVMDAVNEHYGIPRMRHEVIIQNSANEEDKPKHEQGRHMNAKAKPETKDAIRKSLEDQTKKFLELLEHPGSILLKAYS